MAVGSAVIYSTSSNPPEHCGLHNRHYFFRGPVNFNETAVQRTAPCVPSHASGLPLSTRRAWLAPRSAVADLVGVRPLTVRRIPTIAAIVIAIPWSFIHMGHQAQLPDSVGIGAALRPLGYLL